MSEILALEPSETVGHTRDWNCVHHDDEVLTWWVHACWRERWRSRRRHSRGTLRGRSAWRGGHGHPGGHSRWQSAGWRYRGEGTRRRQACKKDSRMLALFLHRFFIHHSHTKIQQNRTCSRTGYGHGRSQRGHDWRGGCGRRWSVGKQLMWPVGL